MYIWTLRKVSKNGTDEIRISNDSYFEMTCPKCGKPLMLRKGQYGDFYGCTGFRDGCRFTLEKKIVDEFVWRANKEVLSQPEKYPHPENLTGYTFVLGNNGSGGYRIGVQLEPQHCI